MYVTLLEKGKGEIGGLVKPGMIHVYDMEVAEDAIPESHDYEVKSFCLMSPEAVKEALLKKELLLCLRDSKTHRRDMYAWFLQLRYYRI